MKPIVITKFVDVYDCDDCGYIEANCVVLESENEEIPSSNFGRADCCSNSHGSIYDALEYLFEKIGKKMEYSNLTAKALERVGNKNPSEMVRKGEIHQKVAIRVYNKRYKYPYGEDFELHVIAWFAEQGIPLVIVEEMEDGFES